MASAGKAALSLAGVHGCLEQHRSTSASMLLKVATTPPMGVHLENKSFRRAVHGQESGLEYRLRPRQLSIAPRRGREGGCRRVRVASSGGEEVGRSGGGELGFVDPPRGELLEVVEQNGGGLSSEEPKSGGDFEEDVNASDWPADWTRGTGPQIAFALIIASIPIVPILPRFPWSASVYFTALAIWAIYVGSHRSLKQRQAQKITLQQSFAVPIVCSFTLFGFYCLLRFFPDLNLGAFISVYLTFVGALAVGSNLSDPLKASLPQLEQWSQRIDLPEWLATVDGERVHVTISPTDVLAAAIGILAALGSRQPGAPFTLSNFVAVAVVTELLQLISLGSFFTAAAMLGGLLVYDVFWVFGSSLVFGDNVMVAVATSDALDGPMKLIFPQWNANSPNPYSILGLGDLAAPGLLIALMLRFDRSRWRQLTASPSPSGDETPVKMKLVGGGAAADKSYFNAAIVAYLVGLGLTIGINTATRAAQPALLYLVPSILLGVLTVAVVRSETSSLFEYRDEPLIGMEEELPAAVKAANERDS